MTKTSSPTSLGLAFKAYLASLRDLSLAVASGRDSLSAASAVAILAIETTKASHAFYEALSRSHAAALGIDADAVCLGFLGPHRPDAPSRTPDDFAHWAKHVAIERSTGPIYSSQSC